MNEQEAFDLLSEHKKNSKLCLIPLTYFLFLLKSSLNKFSQTNKNKSRQPICINSSNTTFLIFQNSSVFLKEINIFMDILGIFGGFKINEHILFNSLYTFVSVIYEYLSEYVCTGPILQREAADHSHRRGQAGPAGVLCCRRPSTCGLVVQVSIDFLSY